MKQLLLITCLGFLLPLANKIKEKHKGYFVPSFAVNLADKVEVYKRIIDEYDKCK